MSFTKQILRILLAIVVASAVKGNCQSSHTIRSKAELENILACSEIEGSLTFDPLFDGAIYLRRLEKITGDLKISGDKIHQIEFLELKSVQTLEISNVPNLEILHVAKLNSVDSLILKEVGKVPAINFGHGLQKAKTIEISSNGLKRIENINIKTLKNLKLTLLSQLSEISFQNLEFVENLEIHNNAILKKTDFPFLKTAGSIKLKNLAEFVTLAVPVVKKIESVEIENINKLKVLSFPALEEASKFDIKNNVNLESINFPKLITINGDALFTANPQATVNMPVLFDAKAKLFFNTIKDAIIPSLSYVIALKYQNVASTNVNFEQLLGVTETIHISNNDHLESVAFPKLIEVRNFGLFIQENPIMNKISFPSLKQVNEKLQINEPSVTEIVWNSELAGRSSDIVANIPNCAEFKKLNFNHDQCVAQGATKNDASLTPKAPEKKEEHNEEPKNEVNNEVKQEKKEKLHESSSSNALFLLPTISGLAIAAFSTLF